jgi:large subunit ribosomal protein L9
MKLLLKKDIPSLGIVGDVVNVSAGYARNYLLPQHLATQPTEANMKMLADARAEAEARRNAHRNKMAATAEALADVEITIEAAANAEGVLYGSVGPREVSAALRDAGHDVTTAQVRMHDPLKRLDNAMVDVVLADTIETKVKVWVVRSKGTEGGAEPQEEKSWSEEQEEVVFGAEGRDK